MTKELVSIKGRVEQLPKLIDALSAKAKAIEARMAALKRAGLIYAKPHWRNQKYFLLVHPMVNGERPTPTYIGTDEEKIKAATDSIARAAEYDALAIQAEAYARQVGDAGRVLRELERALS